MKTDITHLPKQIQNDLAYITEFLVKDYEVAASNGTSNKQNCANITNIILHGRFTEDDLKSDTELLPTEEASYYNILILVTKILPDSLYQVLAVEKQINSSGELAYPVRLQMETVTKLNKLLKDGYLAYDQIEERSILLYNSGGKGRNLLHMPHQPNAAKHYIRARDHFDRAFPLAQSFLSGAQFFRKTDHNAAAFMLHISAEQAYEAFMLVHILYYPYSRTLMDLREVSESIHQELQFVWAGREGRRSFFKLKCAFKGPRYTPDYKITRVELDRMFKYVKELHKLINYICQLKFEELKAGSLKKPNKDWLEIIGEVLTQPKPEALKDRDGSIETPGDDTPKGAIGPTKVIETTDIDTAVTDPSPIYRTPEQEEALEKLRTKIFDLEEPCFELEQLGCVLKSMAHGDDDAELSGIFVMGRVVQERAHMIKDIFKQMVDLLRQTRIRDDDPAEDKSDPNSHDHFTDSNLKRSQEGPGQIMI
ncbi:MAG: hypothetical protein L3J79_10300 [Candidatus Marinimicrobia bacterium]|nr:hypothetical protein [Candidatus Neomarinimicrobiota bacterium]